MFFAFFYAQIVCPNFKPWFTGSGWFKQYKKKGK